jgi:DNA repair protein RadC
VACSLPHLAWHRVEEVWALPVDARLRPLERVLIARGGAASCAVTPAEILAVALRVRARGLFLVHNHPSGDPTPSPDDIAFTARLLEAAAVLDVRIEDHLVLGGGRFASVLSRRRGALRRLVAGAQRWKRSGTVTRRSLPPNCGT